MKHFLGRIWEALLWWEKTFGGEERLFSVESCGNPWLPVAQNGIPEESEFSWLDTFAWQIIFRDSKAMERCLFNGWSTFYIFIMKVLKKMKSIGRRYAPSNCLSLFHCHHSRIHCRVNIHLRRPWSRYSLISLNPLHLENIAHVGSFINLKNLVEFEEICACMRCQCNWCKSIAWFCSVNWTLNQNGSD